MADSMRAGNRFDSPVGRYGVLYFGTHLRACFAETLARLRPAPGMGDVVAAEWAELGFMPVGGVAADWRHRRLAVRARPIEPFPFVDVEAPETLQVLRDELAHVLALYGYDDLDVGLIRGPDRRVTRAISHWAFSHADDEGRPEFAGLRYVSRHGDDLECWAVFDDVPLEELEKRPVTREMPELVAIAKLFGLTVH